MNEITPLQLKERLQDPSLQLVDVREASEYETARLGGVLIPLGDLVMRYRELDPKKETVVICHHGMRSAQAAMLLLQLGFDDVKNLTGGIDRWSTEVDPSVPRY